MMEREGKKEKLECNLAPILWFPQPALWPSIIVIVKILIAINLYHPYDNVIALLIYIISMII